jgi:hypothetical protein
VSLLYSNYPPLKTQSSTYHDTFKDLIEVADRLSIATGYISADAVVDLRNIIEINNGPFLQLNIGMHYFEGLSLQQKQALEDLDLLLREKDLGGVYMVVTFPFHGKLMSFTKSGSNVGSLIGSSNLTNIIENKTNRQYEVDYLLKNDDAVEVSDFISKLNEVATTPFAEARVKVVQSKNTLLNDQYGVEKVTDETVKLVSANIDPKISFNIGLKADDATRSNLNTFNGKGRENKQKFVMPRSWYEVELIVPKAIASLPGYPQSDKDGDGGVIEVITDDGWEFTCKISGQNSKNLRSEKDLKILGKWLKGRLEQSGALKTGELVTSETFRKYGRDTFTLSKLRDSDKWYIDFGVAR